MPGATATFSTSRWSSPGISTITPAIAPSASATLVRPAATSPAWSAVTGAGWRPMRGTYIA